MNQHPLSAAFPAMSAEDFQALKDSIEAIGVQNPVTLYEGMVIDGWHRYTAAQAVGVDCPTVELSDVDPRDFVLAQNKARRHITQAQLAMATTAVYGWYPAGNPALSQPRTECGIGKTSSELASIAGVGQRTIEQAKAVQANATTEVQDAVKRGEIGLVKAAAIAKLPQKDQAAALAKPMPKPAAKPEPENDDMGIDPIAELEEAYQRINELEEQVVSLSQSEMGAECAKQIKMRQQFEALLARANDQLKHVSDDRERMGKVLKALMQHLEVDSYKAILPRIREMGEAF